MCFSSAFLSSKFYFEIHFAVLQKCNFLINISRLKMIYIDLKMSCNLYKTSPRAQVFCVVVKVGISFSKM